METDRDHSRDTAALIRRLGQERAPAAPLPRPSVRMAVWLFGSLPLILPILFLWPSEGPLAAKLGDHGFLIEEAAAALTAMTAAIAAFATTVPGYNRGIALAPLLPLGIWMVSVGNDCLRDAGSVHGMAIFGHWPCLALTVIVGMLPAAVMAIMLRRGAPLAPRLSTALGGLAVAGLANFAALTIHAYDTSLLVLVWHLGAVFLASALASGVGKSLLHWNLPPRPARA